MGKHLKERQDRYFAVHHFMLKTEAWGALSAPARAIYFQLGFRYNGGNNGRIALSVRDAAEECNLARNTAARAFQELSALGFIEETRHGSLSRKTRIASEWRLTAFRCDLTGNPKTCLFMQRGMQARDNRQPRSRPQTPARLSQTTASETPEPVANDGRECRKRRHSLSQTTASDAPECRKRRPVKPVFGGSPVANDGTHIIYQVGVSSETTTAGPPLAALASFAPPVADASTPHDAFPSNALAMRDTAKLVWTKPIVRELFGEERMRALADLGASAPRAA
jgi:hypothetical protein